MWCRSTASNASGRSARTSPSTPIRTAKCTRSTHSLTAAAAGSTARPYHGCRSLLQATLASALPQVQRRVQLAGGAALPALRKADRQRLDVQVRARHLLLRYSPLSFPRHSATRRALPRGLRAQDVLCSEVLGVPSESAGGVQVSYRTSARGLPPRCELHVTYHASACAWPLWHLSRRIGESCSFPSKECARVHPVRQAHSGRLHVQPAPRQDARCLQDVVPVGSRRRGLS
jgi:hypothetical protein